ncbi:SDR family oxidoreductase [Celerinatantimonas sp. YJH-8]|uniref:SDR family oxidoreductase n=1 Tax=Celerinatantimonas sp. YJH-8 TaxID=3228714 RepID=UPI0038C47C80
MQLAHKTIILTGASGGIGSAIAHQFALQEVNLVLVGRSLAKLYALQRDLPGGPHYLIEADLATTEGRRQFDTQLTELKTQGVSIDGLINNAGHYEFNWFERRGLSDIEQELQLNLITPIEVCHMVLPNMNRPGIILNVGSTFGSIGYPGYSCYCAAKSGLHRFSEALDRELSGLGVRVLYVAPRATRTPLNQPLIVQMNASLGNREDAPETVAEIIAQMFVSETSSRWIGWPEKLFAKINQLLPDVVSRQIRRQFPTLSLYMDEVGHKEPLHLNKSAHHKELFR